MRKPKSKDTGSARLFRAHRRLGCVIAIDRLGRTRPRSKVLIPFACGPTLARATSRPTHRPCSTPQIVKDRLASHFPRRGERQPSSAAQFGLYTASSEPWHGMSTHAKECVWCVHMHPPTCGFLTDGRIGRRTWKWDGRASCPLEGPKVSRAPVGSGWNPEHAGLCLGAETCRNIYPSGLARSAAR